MRSVRYSAQFKRDFKLCEKRGCDERVFVQIITLLRSEIALPAKHRDHSLIGEYIGHRECHIAPDWLLIYKLEPDNITLSLTRMGTHADLF